MCNNLRKCAFIYFLLAVVLVDETLAWRHFGNLTRERRQAPPKCENGFSCKSGDCVSEDVECDGKVDCRDGSDETNACQRFRCQSYLFKCKYGACINKELECDGKNDCRDGSDEQACLHQPGNNTISTCKDDQFQCADGKCIREDDKCDGFPQCDDKSDESAFTCSSMRCPGFTYRCAYGACVDGDAECNGISECYDQSDEDPKKCPAATPVPPLGTQRPPLPGPGTPRGSCVLPNHPANGRWNLVSGSLLNPGETVISNTPIEIRCNPGYKLDGDLFILCRSGKWSAGIGNCLPICSDIVSTPTMDVTCKFKDKETVNCSDVLSGAVAKFTCKVFYEDPSLKKNFYRYCIQGKWDANPPNCLPVCGVKTPTAEILSVNGTQVKRGDYPWQVAIYTLPNKLLTCGGSLITQRVILSAAHCFADASGLPYRAENFEVAVGKYYRKYDAEDDSEAQFSKLERIEIPKEYRGDVQNYQADIAILITVKVFELSKRCLPVCVDWGKNYESYFQRAGIKGYVAGWGNTVETGQPSNVLQEIQLPNVDYEACREELPQDYESYLTHDKMCAGYVNQSKAACKGDSGGGLVFKNADDSGRYYIVGIVSLSPLSPSASGGCNSQLYGLFTRVSEYIEKYISPIESTSRPRIQ